MAKASKPAVKSGNATAIHTVMKRLQQLAPATADSWIRAKSDGQVTSFESLKISDKTNPNLAGMEAKDALFLCEDAGLRVHLSGVGKVVGQSLPAGSRVVRGQTITLQLVN